MAKMFLDVFNLSITASWLIAAVILVRLVIRHRAPKWVTCLLWAMVGIRLVIPFSLESTVSLIPSRETIIPESVYGETVVQTPDITPPEQDNPDVGIDTPNEGIDTPNEGIDIPDEYIPPAIENIPEEYIHSGIGAIDDRVNPIIQSTATIENGKSRNILQTVTFAASCVWILGMVSLVIYAVINYLLLKKRVATSIPEGKDVRKSEAVGSPFILGVFRPRIYMPFGLSKATEEHVLAHERAHLKRGDHLIKPIGYAILTVHWFNPLVWLGYILLCRDIEYACDEKVVKNMSAEARKAYAEALLECGVSKSRISACPVAFGETGVKKRVKNTMNYKKPLFWVMIAAIIICAAVAVFFLTSPAANDKKTSDTSDVSDVVDVSNVSDVIDESDVSKSEDSNNEEIKKAFAQIAETIKADTEKRGRIVYDGYSLSYDFENKIYALETDVFKYGYKDKNIDIIVNNTSHSVVSGDESDYNELISVYAEPMFSKKDTLLKIINTPTLNVDRKTSDNGDQVYQFNGSCTLKNTDNVEEESFVRGALTIYEGVGCYFIVFVDGVQTDLKLYFDTQEISIDENAIYKTDTYSSLTALKESMTEFNRFYNSFFVYEESVLANKLIEVNLYDIRTFSPGAEDDVWSYLNMKQIVLKNDDDIISVFSREWMPYNAYPLNESTRLDGFYSNIYSYLKDGEQTVRRQQYGYGYQFGDYWEEDKTETTQDSEEFILLSDYIEDMYENIAFSMNRNDFDSHSKNDIELYLLRSANFIGTEYTYNSDGTVTVSTDCTDRYLSFLYYHIRPRDGTIIDKREYKNSFEDTANFTYDLNTGMIIGFDFSATDNNGDLKIQISLKTQDADESMLPEKAELLAGNW